MRLDASHESRNVEDRRGMRLPGGRRGGLGCIGLLAIVVIALVTGADPQRLLSILGGIEEQVPTSSDVSTSVREDDPQAHFASRVLGTTESTWERIFAASGSRYEEPVLVLFDGSVESACGYSSAAVGPFYCPGDHKVYLDLSFFRQLDRRFGAPGDFAQAYVVAHEVGHHVQNLMGVSDHVERARQRARSDEEANRYSVMLELQADCYAGVWGHDQQSLLDPGDLEEGLRAAAAIGDDTLQRQSQGYVAPESWTHGSSRMRVQWLKRGLETGDPRACDTFAAME
jgi:predicted metalloprotease